MTWDSPDTPEPYTAKERARQRRLQAHGWHDRGGIPGEWESLTGRKVNAHEIRNMADEEFDALLTAV